MAILIPVTIRGLPEDPACNILAPISGALLQTRVGMYVRWKLRPLVPYRGF